MSCHLDIDRPQSKQNIGPVEFGPVEIEQPVELKAVGDSAIVWAMGAGDGADLAKPKEVKKMLETTPWVLILRLKVQKKR